MLTDLMQVAGGLIAVVIVVAIIWVFFFDN